MMAYIPLTPESALQLPLSPISPEGPPRIIGGPRPKDATLSPSDRHPAACNCLLAYLNAGITRLISQVSHI